MIKLPKFSKELVKDVQGFQILENQAGVLIQDSVGKLYLASLGVFYDWLSDKDLSSKEYSIKEHLGKDSNIRYNYE